ncbi:MAG: ferrous iron transport protein B [Muribaculaceae bacterium]
MLLSELNIGQSAKILTVGGAGALRQHLLDMGLIPGGVVKLMKYAPMGDPIELRIHDYELTLRRADASLIKVEPLPDNYVDNTDYSAEVVLENHAEHPGFGEMGPEHNNKQANPLPKNQTLSFALVGNQNCGKTTLFNQLTGSNQHVGNFPGVTVEGKSGSIKGHSNTVVTDLPGIYSLSPYTCEEVVSRDFILNQKPSAIINIVDATNIERNLYLTMQLMELDVPMVLALNMMDEVENNHGAIRVNLMEQLLGIPVVPISAAKNQGVDELVQHALHVAHYQERPRRNDFCNPDTNGAVHRGIHAIMHLIEDHAEKAGIPRRFAACKLVEGDNLVLNSLNLPSDELGMLNHVIKQLEEHRGLDRGAAIADMRYSFIRALCHQTVVKPHVSKEHQRSRLIDTVLTGKWTAIPSFLLIMAFTFWMTFDVIGGTMQQWCDEGINEFAQWIDALLIKWNIEPTVQSLIIDGIIGGVGSVISFLPIIVTLFFFLSMLEDSGYMARIAFVMDKSLRKIGLSGRSIVPLLIGFGCSVPSIMASRTLPSLRDRKLTIMLTPFMSCTAKLPIYVFFTAVFFPDNAALVMVCLYLIGIVVGIGCALLLKYVKFTGSTVPFVMELPNYRMPGYKNVTHLLCDKAKDFLQRAFTIIFLASLVIWFMQTFDFRLHVVDDSSTSMLAVIAGYIAPLFSPMGFGDWRITTALISGFIAKESVVSTLTVLFGSATSITSLLTTGSALSMLVFCLLYTPCVATIACIRRELNNHQAMVILIGQCVIAWLCALAVSLIANLII